MQRNDGFSAGVYVTEAYAGANFLKNYDLAVDQKNFELVLKPTLVNNWESKEKAEIAYYLEQTKADEKGKEADASDWDKLSKAYIDIGEYEEAEKAALKAAELEPETCAYHGQIGNISKQLNKFEQAEKSYKKATELYHAWWSIPLEERLNIKKTQAKMDKKTKKNAKEQTKNNPEKPLWHYIQSEDCHRAEGDRASILLAKGDFDGVETLYREKLDLDADLAMVYGNSKLISGDLTKAHEAYRQALILEARPMARHRMGLALYFVDQGKWKFAAPLFEEALRLNPHSVINGGLWLDNARTHDPKSDNLKRAKDFRDKNPTSSAAQFLWAREAKLSDAADYESTIKTVGDYFDLNMAQDSKPLLVSAHIHFLVLTEEFGEAEAQISKFNFWKNNPEILLAKAELQSAQGNTEAAMKLLHQAGSIASTHPSFALFLKKQFKEKSSACCRSVADKKAGAAARCESAWIKC